MSQSIERFKCRACGSNNVTYDPTAEIVTCNVCGYTYSTHGRISYNLPQEETMSSASVVAGTLPPRLAIKTEEVVGYRRVTQEVFPHTHEEFKKLESDIEELKNIVNQLDSKVEELRGIFPKVVVVEEVPKEEARHRVLEYFKEHKTADIEELMLNLKIPVQTIVEIIDKLKREGKITTEEK